MDRTRQSFLQGALLSAGVLAARGAAGAQDRKDTMKMPHCHRAVWHTSPPQRPRIRASRSLRSQFSTISKSAESLYANHRTCMLKG